MLPDASKNLVVHCDMCGKPMTANPVQGMYTCMPCKNLIYESDLWRYDTQVRRPTNATSGD